MSGGGGVFRGRGFGSHSHHRQGPNGPGISVSRPNGSGGRSGSSVGSRNEGSGSRINLSGVSRPGDQAPRSIGSNIRPEGPNARLGGSNFRGGTGTPHGPRPNFNSARRPPRHPLRSSDNWVPRGGSSHYANWRGGRPPRFTGAPRPFYRGRGNNFNPYRFPYMGNNNMGSVMIDFPSIPDPKPAIPHLGSEEERLQKITEAADELKRKLSAGPNDTDVWYNDNEDDAVMDSATEEYESRIANRGIPELKHDPPELNLTLNDLRDIGRVDHDRANEQTKTNVENPSNSPYEDTEVEILDYNPVGTMIEIDLWSDDNYMELDDDEPSSNRSNEQVNTATGAMETTETSGNTVPNAIQDKAAMRDTHDTDLTDDIDGNTPHAGIGNVSGAREAENEKRKDCEIERLEEKRDGIRMKVEKTTETPNEIIGDIPAENTLILHENSRIETQEDNIHRSSEDNVHCTLTEQRNKKEAIHDKNVEDARIKLKYVNKKETLASSSEKFVSLAKESQVEKINKVRDDLENAVPGSGVTDSFNEKKSSKEFTDVTGLKNYSSALNEASDKSETAIVAKKTKASREQTSSENREDTTKSVSGVEIETEIRKDDTPLESPQEASTESRRQNTRSLSSDNDKSKTQQQPQDEEITNKSRSASISDGTQVRKGITIDARNEGNKEESKKEIKDNDIRKRNEQFVEASSRSENLSNKTNANGKTEAREKTEIPRKVDITRDSQTDKKNFDKPKTESSSSRDKNFYDDNKSSTTDNKTCERRKLVRKMPEGSAGPRNRKTTLAESIAKLQRSMATMDYDSPVVFDRRGPPSTRPFPKKHYRIPAPIIQETAINQQPPVAFDPRLSSLERTALLASGALAPTSIPIAQDFGMNAVYPPCAMTTFVPNVAPMNYGGPPMIGGPVESPICLPDPYVPLLAMTGMPTTIPLPAEATMMLQPPLPIEPPPPPPPPVKSNLDMVDELEDMQEAMEFAKRFMNMGDVGEIGGDSEDSDFFHMPTFPNLPPIELPPLPPPEIPPPSAIPPPLDAPPPPIISENMISSTRRSVLNESCKTDTRLIKKEPIAYEAETIPNADEGRSKNDLSTLSIDAAILATTRQITRVTNGHENRETTRTDGKSSSFNGSYLSHTKKPDETPTNRSRSRSPSPSKREKNSKDEESRSTPTYKEKTEQSLRRGIKDSSAKRTTDTPRTPESSWKNRVIGRFLKMSKNDICNMLNNTSLRKFDIAMKHLVKERRSSLSLGMRNNEEEKMKGADVSYDREEFMDQLSAMLDPSATVDVCNLPTQFIHHLSEVLQLDSISDFEVALTPTDTTEIVSSMTPVAPSPSISRVPRAPNVNVKEIDDRRPAKRGRDKKPTTTCDSAIEATSMTTTTATPPPISSTTVARKLATRTCDDTVETRCAKNVENIVPETNTNRVTALSGGRRRRSQPTSAETQDTMTVNNGSANRNETNSLNMADLDDIFSPGIVRERNKLSSIVVTATNETRTADFHLPLNTGNNEVARDPTIDRVERAAVELDKIFTAGIARFKLPSIKAAASASRAAEGNDDDDDDEDGNWNRDERKSNLDSSRTRRRSISRFGTKNDKWSKRKAYEDRDAFRNLTKEEWEAKYGESSYTSYEQEYRAMVATKDRKNDYEFTTESEDNTGVKSRLGNEIPPDSSTYEAWSDIDIAARFRNANDSTNYDINDYHRSSGDNGSSSSSISTSSESSDDETEAESVHKLLREIKAKEKIAKTKSLNEEIRDEVAAEIEKKRREREKLRKSRHKSRPKKSHRRKKERKERVKERKKKERKKRKHRSRRSGSDFRESSDGDYTDEEYTSSASRGRKSFKLLTENEIKKEIVVKDEPEEVMSPTHYQRRSKSSLAIRLQDEARPPSRSSASSLPAVAVTSSTVPSPATIQPKTKAQLKQMPAVGRKVVAATVVSKEIVKTQEIPVDEAKENATKIVAATPMTDAIPPVISEPTKSPIALATTSSVSSIQIQQISIPTDEISSSAKSNSKKLDIKAYKERNRLRQIRETEKLRQRNENPSALTRDLLNISLVRKNVAETTEDAVDSMEREKHSVIDGVEQSKSTIITTTTSNPTIFPQSSSISGTICPMSPLTIASTTTSPPTIVSTTTSPLTIASTTTSPPAVASTTTTSPLKIVATTTSPLKIVSTTTSPPTIVSTTTSPPTIVSTTTSPPTVVAITTSPPTIVSTTTSPPTVVAITTSPPTVVAITTSPPTIASQLPTPRKIISAANPMLINSPAEATNVSTSERSGSQLVASKYVPPTKLIRRRSLTSAPKISVESTTAESRAEAGKFAHIKSEGRKEMKLREKLKNQRPRPSVEGLESTIPPAKPARVRKRSSVSSETTADEGTASSSEKTAEKPATLISQKAEEEPTAVTSIKIVKEEPTVPSEKVTEDEATVPSEKIAEDEATVPSEKIAEDEATVPSEKITVDEAIVSAEKTKAAQAADSAGKTTEDIIVSVEKRTEEQAIVSPEKNAKETIVIPSEKRTEEQTIIPSEKRTEETVTVDTTKRTEESMVVVSENSTEKLVAIKTEQSTEESVVYDSEKTAAETASDFTETIAKEFTEVPSEILQKSTEEPVKICDAIEFNSKQFDFFKTGMRSDALPDTVPQEYLVTMHIPKKLEEVVDSQTEIETFDSPITDLPEWPLESTISSNPNVQLNDSNDDPPFRGFTKDSIILNDRILTEAEGNITELNDPDASADGVMNLDDVTSTGVSLDAPVSYGDDEFVEDGVEIETSLLGFPVANDITDVPETIALGTDNDIIEREDKSIEKSFLEESSRESAELLSRVTPTLNDSPVPNDFLISNVQSQESVPSAILVTESIRDEPSESPDLSLKDKIDEEHSKENKSLPRDDTAEVSASHAPENKELSDTTISEPSLLDADMGSKQSTCGAGEKEIYHQMEKIKSISESQENQPAKSIISEERNGETIPMAMDSSSSRNNTPVDRALTQSQRDQSNDVVDETNKETTEKIRTVDETRVGDAKTKESNRGSSKSATKDHNHSRNKKKSSRHHLHGTKSEKKSTITEKMVEEAISANIVKIIPNKLSSREWVLARMMEIDVEIHKLMNEKMTLYTMLQSGEFTAKDNRDKVSDIKTNVEAKLPSEKEEAAIPDIAPSTTVSASHSARNLEKTILITPTRVHDTKKINSENDEKSKRRKKSPQREIKNRGKESGETVENRRQRHNSETKSHSRRTTSEEPSNHESASSNSREKSSSPTELDDADENRRKRKTKVLDSSKRQATRRAPEHSSKEDVREASRESTDRSGKSAKRDSSPKREKTKKKINKTQPEPKKIEESTKIRKIEEKSNADGSKQTEKIGSVIYSDESTWDSLDPDAIQSDEQRGKKDGTTGSYTGLALLEETFKREIAQTKKGKTVERRKNKKQELRRVILDASTFLTAEAEMASSDMQDRKNSRKKGTVASSTIKGKSLTAGTANENPEKVWKHMASVIDAVAADRVEQLYSRHSSPTSNDSTPTTSTSGRSVELDLARERSPSISLTESMGSEKSESTKKAKSDISKMSQKRETDLKESDNEETEETTKSKVSTKSKTIEKNYLSECKESETSETTSASERSSPVEYPKKSRDVDTSSGDNTSKTPDADMSTKTTAKTKPEVKVEKEENVKISTSADRFAKKNESKGSKEKETETRVAETSRSPSPDLPSTVPSRIKFHEAKFRTKEKQKYESSNLKTESTNEVSPEDNEFHHSSRETDGERVRSHSRSERPFKRRSITPRDKERERREKNSSRTDDNNDRHDKSSGRPKSATKRRQREKSVSSSHRISRHSEERSKRSRSKKRERERSHSRGGSSHDSESSRKRLHHSHRSSSPKVQSTLTDEQSRRRGRKRKRRPEMSLEEMMNCKVQLIDCKYTYLSPEMRPRVLKKFGISRINPYVPPTLVAESSSPIEVTRADTPSPPTLIKVETIKEIIEEPSSPKEIHNSEETNDRRDVDHVNDDDEAEDEDGADETIHIVKVVENMQNSVISDQEEDVDVPEIIDETSCPIDTIPPDVIAVEDETTDEIEPKTDTTDEIVVIDEKITRTEKTIEKQQKSTVSEVQEDITHETKRTRYTVHKGPILDIKVLDDSFLAASEDGAIYRYSQTSNGILNIYKGHEAAVTCIYVLEVSANHWNLYSGSLDGTFRCYDITTGAQERPPADVGSPVQCMDQAWGVIFVGTKSGHISRYNIKSGSIKGDRLEFSDKSVLALKASSEGPRRVLIVASRNQPITIRDALTGLFLRTICGYKSHTVYSLMREKNLVYCGTSSTSIPVFDFTNGEQVTQYNAGVGIVCMRLYRQILFAGCYDGNIYVFDTKEAKLIVSIPGPGNMLLSMEVIGDEIIAGSKDRQLHSWRMPRQVRALLAERT